jgi:hypothetical protein
MHKNQNASNTWIEQKRVLFKETAKLVDEGVFGGKAPPKLPVTVLEALLVGVGANLPRIKEASPAQLRSGYDELVLHKEFSEGSLREGLSKKPRGNRPT